MIYPSVTQLITSKSCTKYQVWFSISKAYYDTTENLMIAVPFHSKPKMSSFSSIAKTNLYKLHV